MNDKNKLAWIMNDKAWYWVIIIFGAAGIIASWLYNDSKFFQYGFLVAAVLFAVYWFRQRIPFMSRLILIMALSVFPAVVVCLASTITFLLLFRPGACDMGGAAILAIIAGWIMGALAYLVSLLIGIVFLIKEKRKKAGEKPEISEENQN